MTVQREDPRPSRHYAKGIDWEFVVKEVKSLDGEFGNIGTYSPGTAQHIRKGKYRAFLPDGFEGDEKAYMEAHYEVTARSVSQRPSRVAVYVRWIG